METIPPENSPPDGGDMWEAPPLPPPPHSERPEFHGKGGEYFKIWIVNFFLTLLTLGIYLPWAKVRTRRYFYRTTLLHGCPFDYTADPRRLLIGYLIVGAAILLYTVGEFISIFLPILLFLLFLALYPWIRWKSVRFFAVNSTYRHIPLGFRGNLGEAYAAFLGYPFLAVITMGLLGPYAAFKGRRFYFDNFRYGNGRSSFSGRPGFFYLVYLSAAGGLMVVLASAAMLIAIFGAWGAMRSFSHDGGGPPAVPLFAEMAQPDNGGDGEGDSGGEFPPWEDEFPIREIMTGFGIALAAVTLLGYLAFFFVLILIRIIILNHCWSHLALHTPAGPVAFHSSIHPVRYAWILFTNLVLTLLTLGIFIPWAKVRLHRYRVACLLVHNPGLLETVTGMGRETEGAVGESATDWLDIDFGL